jgi:hypothetical protein
VATVVFYTVTRGAAGKLFFNIAGEGVAPYPKAKEFGGWTRAHLIGAAAIGDVYQAPPKPQTATVKAPHATPHAAPLESQAVKPQPATPGAVMPGMALVTHFHTKRAAQVYVVTMAERVARDTYTTLLAAAKARGGWYAASYQGSPAGFMFTSPDAARDFMQTGA